MSGPVNGHPHDRLSEYLDDQLSVEERAVIDRHLASCEDCRAQLDALRRVARALADESVPPPPVDLHEEIGRRLDEATVLRPRRWRFAVPATIAATISVIGILIAVQWREGRLTPPRVQEAVRSAESPKDKKAVDEVAQAPAPTLPPPTKTDERSDSDAAGAREKVRSEIRSVPEPKESLPVEGEAAGGQVGGVEEVTGGAHENRARAAVAAPNQPTVDNEAQDRFLQKQSNVAAAPPQAPAPTSKLEAASICADRWSDSGARGTWETPDPVAAARELDTIAHGAWGMGLWRGIDDGRPYLLVVPRSRFTEVFHVLGTRGVAGLVDPPVLAKGDDCVAISIAIVQAR